MEFFIFMHKLLPVFLSDPYFQSTITRGNLNEDPHYMTTYPQ